jgi:hypothetical protein
MIDVGRNLGCNSIKKREEENKTNKNTNFCKLHDYLVFI